MKLLALGMFLDPHVFPISGTLENRVKEAKNTREGI